MSAPNNRYVLRYRGACRGLKGQFGQVINTISLTSNKSIAENLLVSSCSTLTNIYEKYIKIGNTLSTN